MVAFSLIYFVTLFDLSVFKTQQNVYFILYTLLNIFIPWIYRFQCQDDDMMTQIARDEIKMGSRFMFYDIYDNRVDFRWLFVVTSIFCK